MKIRNFGLMMVMAVASATTLIGETTDREGEPIEEIGYIEEDGEVANADSRQRNDITFYDKNREQIRDKRRLEAIRAWRAAQAQQVCCPECGEPQCHEDRWQE